MKRKRKESPQEILDHLQEDYATVWELAQVKDQIYKLNFAELNSLRRWIDQYCDDRNAASCS